METRKQRGTVIEKSKAFETQNSMAFGLVDTNCRAGGAGVCPGIFSVSGAGGLWHNPMAADAFGRPFFGILGYHARPFQLCGMDCAAHGDVVHTFYELRVFPGNGADPAVRIRLHCGSRGRRGTNSTRALAERKQGERREQKPWRKI